MEIKFSKYHGVGNDFIIIDYFDYDFSLLAKEICNRNVGIGADGLIVARDNPLTMGYYNQDGSVGTMCGNGLRCFSKYVFDRKIVNTNSFLVNTLAGKYKVTVDGDLIKTGFKNIAYTHPLTCFKVLDSNCYDINTGVPHIVIFTNKIEDEYAVKLYEAFDKNKNINFVEVVNKNELKVRTYERGIGFTLACGTGGIASFKIARLLNLVEEKIKINYKYGVFSIEEEGEIINLSSSATKIAEGVFYLD